MSAAKQRGTAAETAVVTWLRNYGYTHVERRALNGSKDRGDIAGIPGWVGEVKAAKTLLIPAWLRELDDEIANASASHGTLIIKPRGVGLTNVRDWWAVQRFGNYISLLGEAGY